MKRLVIRLSVFSAVVVLGVVVFAIAQQITRSSSDNESAANEGDEKPAAANIPAPGAVPKPIPLTAEDPSATDSAVPQSPFATGAFGSPPSAESAPAPAAFGAAQDTGAATPVANPSTPTPVTPPAITDYTPAPTSNAAADDAGQDDAGQSVPSGPISAQPPALSPTDALPETADVTPPSADFLNSSEPPKADAAFRPSRSNTPDADYSAPSAAASSPGSLAPAASEPQAYPRTGADALPTFGAGGNVPETDATGGGSTTETLSAEGIGRPGTKNLDGPQTPTLTVEKTAPAEIQIGKPATFQIKVRNVGLAAAHEVVVRDEVPQGTRLISTTPQATETAGVVVWQLGTIEPNEEVTVSTELMPLAEGEIGSVATVGFQAQASVRTVATRPRLTLEHTAPRQVLIGESATLNIKISNPGSGAATGVILEEDVPEGLTHPAGDALEFEVGTLKPGETRELQLTLKAAQAGVVQNVIRARADANLLAEDRSEIEVIAPKLVVSMTGPRKRYLERQATYTFSVSNPGTAVAKDIELVARLPKGLRFIETDHQGQYDSQSHAVYWSLEELPPQKSGTVQLTTLPIETGEQKIRVETQADMGLSDVREQSVLVEGLAALFFEVADAADPIEIGKETVYEIRVVNQGSKTSTNIHVEVEFPPDMRPSGGEGPTEAAVDGQRVVFAPLARLAPKADTLFKIHAEGLRAGDQRIRVSLSSDEISLPVTKEESTRVYADQ